MQPARIVDKGVVGSADPAENRSADLALNRVRIPGGSGRLAKEVKRCRPSSSISRTVRGHGLKWPKRSPRRASTSSAFGLTGDGHGYVGLIGSDDASTRDALDEIRCKYREVQVLPLTLEHVPGTAAKLARSLGNAGINIEFFMPTGESGNKTIFALGVDRIDEARRILGSQVTSEYGSLWPKAVAHAGIR